MTKARKVKGHEHKCSEAPDSLLMKNFADLISAGDKLAEAGHRVQAEHDGVHRLRLAMSNWYKVRADEFWRKP